MDFDMANKISDQIGRYEEAVKYADDDERDEINIYDYVSEEYREYVEQSQSYWGIISDKKKAPSAYLLYQGNIRKEIGLIKCKSESTKKEVITTVIDGMVAENYKFLKNDILKVDVVLLIHKIFERIGIPHFNVSELTRRVETDKKVWDLYANGFTIGLNQCEKESTTKKLINYKPKNISELTAFIAAIRPAFKSMYSKFESREPFDYGIPVFDRLIQTEQFPYSFILYQEQTMNTLNFAGFPIDQCYGIIKAIAKKHPEKVRPLKAKFIDGFQKKILQESDSTVEEAIEMSEKVWKIIDDSCGYGFNSSHAYCMALDSLYCAWLKANYTYEFYEVLLQHYSEKGNKDKVALIKKEMLVAFGIEEGYFRFGTDNRTFRADKENKVIYSALVGIKGLNQGLAVDLYKLSQKRTYTKFYELYKDLLKLRTLNSSKLNTLVGLGYFDCFAKPQKIYKFIDAATKLYERSQFNKANVDDNLVVNIQENSKETEKQYRNFDYDSALTKLWDELPNEDLKINEKMWFELERLGYVRTKVDIGSSYYFIQGYECKYKNPIITLYRMNDGHISTVKVKRSNYDNNPINVGDMIRIIDIKQEGRWKQDGTNEDGKPKWVQDHSNKESILRKWNTVK